MYYNKSTKGGDNMTLGERIKILRKKINLNQSEFGKKLGITESAVCSYENNRRIPSEQVIVSICREFNVDRDWLVDGEGNDMFLPEPTEIIDELITQYDLDDTEIEILKKYLALSKIERKEFMKIFKKIF